MADYVKIPELARRLDVSEKTARRYVKTAVLPSRFIGGAYRVRVEDLERFIEDAKVEPAGKALAPPSPQPPLFSGSETEEERRAIEALSAHLDQLETALTGGELDKTTATVQLSFFEFAGKTVPALAQSVTAEAAMRRIAARFVELGRELLEQARRLGVGDESKAEAVVFDIEQYRRAG